MPKRQTHAASYDPRTVKQKIVDTPLGEEMSTSFLAYAYSVIYARALPDARDGLKPVQRRIIYQMGQMNLTPDKPYMKSARVVGEVMGKLHPHGDSAIYESMVRLAQDFAMRLPLVDGHGNFGSLDDGPAASRYTEARLAPAALGMNESINEETVDFAPNYDNKLHEPTVLPSAIPNLLVNGASGIAVGMATNMITHNLAEVVAGAKYLMAHPDATTDDLMHYIPGPDLPGGGIIMGREGIKEAYESGRGSFSTRATTHIENVTARKKAIVVTELPFMVGPEKVLERISDGVKNKKLDGISGAIDLTDRHNGTRLVIEIKTGFDPHAVLGQLFKYKPLEDSFTINNVALVGGRPHTMGLKELLDVWIQHRREVITRRSQYRKRKAEERLHLVDGLLLALIDINEVIEVIRSSDNADSAKTRLMAVFDLDEIQAQYILDLRLRRLTKMSRIELESERDDLQRAIAELDEILASDQRRDAVVIESMDHVVRDYGTPRRTVLLDVDEEGAYSPVPAAELGQEVDASIKQGEPLSSALATASLAASAPIPASAGSEGLKLEDKPCAIILSADRLIGRASTTALDLWRSRPLDAVRQPHDQIRTVIPSSTLASYGIVTSAGRLVLAHTADLPLLHLNPDKLSLSAQGGVRVDDLLTHTESTEAVAGEKAITVIPLAGSKEHEGESEDKDKDESKEKAAGGQDGPTPLAIGTARGIVKRWNMDSPTTMDSWSIIDLKDDDSLVFAAPATDADRLVFISSDSSLLTYTADNVRPQGRNAGGMGGIKLADGSRVLAFAVVPAGQLAWVPAQEEGDQAASGAVVVTVAGDAEALTGTDNGSAKVTPLELYPTKGRNTGGVRSQRFLKGQNSLLAAFVGPYPVLASSESGHPVALPDISEKRDGSGTDLTAPIAYLS